MATAGATGLARAATLSSMMLVVVGVLSGLFLRLDDPYRCRALLRHGSWLDPPDHEGSRAPFTTWQPPGCIMRRYTKEDIRDCMEGRHMVFFGDSTTRQIYYGMARLLDSAKANQQRETSNKHGVHDAEFAGVRLYQAWTPLAEDGDNLGRVKEQLALYQHEKLNPVPVEEQKSPALVLMGIGIWFAARFENNESLPIFQSAFGNVSDLLQPQDWPPFATPPMDPRDGTGSEFFVAPPAVPFYDEMPEYRKTGVATNPGELEAIDDYLRSVEDETNMSVLWAYPALSRNQSRVIVDQENGFHVTDGVAETKANILLNLRCNAKMQSLKGYPFDGTCCTDYGGKTALQMLLICIGVAYVGMVLLLEFLPGSAATGRGGFFNLDAGIFVTALLACYLADRTHTLAKGSKQFVPAEFFVLTSVALVAGIIGLSRTPPPPPKLVPLGSPVNDKPLSRDQTDEWKGWMQALILIYHWTGASRNLPIYVVVRLLVAAYIFQTGYGHAVYFVTRKDFSFRRVAAVLLRLNLLSCALPYFMGTDYMFYYFAPLVSFWFLIIYATFAVGKRYNDSSWALVAKLALSASSFHAVTSWTPVMEWAFGALRLACRIEWDLREWQFRLGLDWMVVYVGMLMGIASARSKMHDQLLSRWYTAVLGVISMPLYCHQALELLGTKQAYNSLHPYVSFVPILSFIAVRNSSCWARTWYSRTFAWLGRCSLETFTLQFHIFLAADTKGVLLLGPFRGDGSLFGDRWRDLLVVVPLFLWMSSRLSECTGALVKILTSEVKLHDAGFENEGKEAEVSLLHGMAARLNSLVRACYSRLQGRVAGLLLVLWALNLAWGV